MKKLIKVLSNCLPLCLLLSSAISASAFYDPQVQRWINRDQIEEDVGLNLYEYLANSPINLIDGDGRATTGILTPGIGEVLLDEAAIEAAKAAAAKAAAIASALATVATTSFCKPPKDPCEVFDLLRDSIRQNHNNVLLKVSNVIKARGSQADLDAIPGLTPALKNAIAVMYQAAADCYAARGRNTKFNEDRARFLRGETPNGPD